MDHGQGIGLWAFLAFCALGYSPSFLKHVARTHRKIQEMEGKRS